jgi:hypothetical protein
MKVFSGLEDYESKHEWNNSTESIKTRKEKLWLSVFSKVRQNFMASETDSVPFAQPLELSSL